MTLGVYMRINFDRFNTFFQSMIPSAEKKSELIGKTGDAFKLALKAGSALHQISKVVPVEKPIVPDQVKNLCQYLRTDKGEKLSDNCELALALIELSENVAKKLPDDATQVQSAKKVVNSLGNVVTIAKNVMKLASAIFDDEQTKKAFIDSSRYLSWLGTGLSVVSFAINSSNSALQAYNKATTTTGAT